MQPVAKGKATKSKRDVWLPVWGWVEADWGKFNYNAEWQGSIPGMKASVEPIVIAIAICFCFCLSRDQAQLTVDRVRLIVQERS